MSGLSGEQERAEEARKMLEWGLRAFERTKLFAGDEIVGEAQVFGGEKSGVALKAAGPVSIFMPLTNTNRLVARIVYRGPLDRAGGGGHSGRRAEGLDRRRR